MSTIRLCYMNLIDRWPGTPNPNRSIPTDGWDNTVDNMITTSANETPPVPVGTKVMAYSNNKHAPGWYTMIYLMFHSYEDGVDVITKTDYSLKGAWCSHTDGSTSEKCDTDLSVSPYYVVSRCYTVVSSEITEQGYGVVLPCATLDSDGTVVLVQTYGDGYGWFWCGGVPPLQDVSHFRGAADNSKGFDFTTDILCRKGAVLFEMTADQSWLTSCDWSEGGLTSDGSGGIYQYPHAITCVSSQ